MRAERSNSTKGQLSNQALHRQSKRSTRAGRQKEEGMEGEKEGKGRDRRRRQGQGRGQRKLAP